MEKSTMVTSFSLSTNETSVNRICEYGESYTKQVENITALIKGFEEDVDLFTNYQQPKDMNSDKNNDTEVLAAVKNLNAILKTKTDKIRHDLKGLESTILQQDQRIQSNSCRVYASLIQSFVDASRLWKSVQMQNAAESKRRFKQHLKATSTNYGSQEIDRLIEQGQMSDHIQHLQGEDDDKQFLTTAKSHLEQIMEMERTIGYIKLMIVELSAIAKSQGQQTDDLEDDARLAAEICFESEASRWRTATRKKHWFVFLAVASACVIGGVSIYYLFFNQVVEVPHVTV